jgi:hypothetical protein
MDGPVDRLSGELREPERAAEVTAPLFERRNGCFSKGKERLALTARLLYHRRRTGGRVVDGTALEMRRTCKGTVGSNPTLSANNSE